MTKHHVLCGIVISCLVSFTHSATPIFKDNAADYIEAGFKKMTRRGVEKEDFTKIEVEAQPSLMVEDKLSIDKKRITLEIKSGDGDWKVINNSPSLRGGVYKWTEYNIEPCMNHNVRIWVHGKDESQSSFNYPHTIAAASLDDIIASGYRPNIPVGVQAGEFSGGGVEVTWAQNKCTSVYDVTYQKVTGGETFSRQVQSSKGNSIILTDGLESCSEYEVRVSAVIGDEYSDENIVTFSTPPAKNAADKLEPISEPTINSVISKWKGFEKLPCISEYIVSICKDGETTSCSTGQKVERDDSLQFLEYESESNLEECSEYALHIKPVHKDVDVEDKVLSFRTRSHPIENIASLLTPVQAEAGDKQTITVKWNAIQCANHYEVFQKVNTVDGKWERIGTTVDNFFKQKGVPCTEYKYGVKVTIDDQESEIVEFDQAIMTKLDESVPYVPSNLDFNVNPSGVELSWDHGKCIDSYRIRACRLDGQDQICDETESITSESNKAKHTIYGLQPCTDYKLHIYPTTSSGELNTEQTSFKTGSPEAKAPEFEVQFNEKTRELNFEWSSVKCASSYRIHQKIEKADSSIIWESQNEEQLSVSLNSPEPCVTYKFMVSATVGSEESKPAAWTDIPVPPTVGISEQPTLVIEEKTNGSVTFVINNNEKNHKCKVDQYHLKYNTEEKFIDPINLEDGKMTILVPKENTKIEGRIKFKGYDVWSPWISSDSPKTEKQKADENNFLLPIIIGSVIVIALVALIIFLVVRKKKSQLKYDAEKAQGNTDESKKLNEQMEEKISNPKK